MSWGEYLQLAPIWVLNLGAIAVMLQITLRRSESLARALTLLSLAVALALTVFPQGAGGPAGKLFVADKLGFFYLGLILVGGLAVTISCQGYFKHREKDADEFYLLLLLAAAGAGIMAVSSHLLSFYLGLEILGVSLYGLIAYERENVRSTEAAVKYLLMAAVTASFFLFGSALLYAQTGSLDLAALSRAMQQGGGPLLLAGIALMLVGAGFKLSLVPFHSWAPDVYEGAPLPIANFFSTVSKTAMIAFLLRLFAAGTSSGVTTALALLAILSMLGGNLLALRQRHAKRMLAYSSSAHMGYAIVPLVAGGAGVAVAVSAYMTAYVLTSLAAFGVLTVLAAQEPWRETEGGLDLRGLWASHPWLCVVLGAALLSLAGMPLTAGFVGKFIVMNMGVRGAAFWSLAALVVGSVLGAFYYLRLLIETFEPAPAGPPVAVAAGEGRPWLGLSLLALLAISLVGLGLFPEKAFTALAALLR
jgi:NADH-quinone oxidoreductase subunit N